MINDYINLVERTKPILALFKLIFPKELVKKRREKAIQERTIGESDLKLLYNRSKLEQDIRTAVIWKFD